MSLKEEPALHRFRKGQGLFSATSELPLLKLYSSPFNMIATSHMNLSKFKLN